MFNKLFASVSSMASFTSIISWVQNLITHLSTDAKDVEQAIDGVIEILQAHKASIVTAKIVPAAQVETITPPQS